MKSMRWRKWTYDVDMDVVESAANIGGVDLVW